MPYPLMVAPLGEPGPRPGTPGTISNTNKVKVRQTSGPSAGITTVATLAIPALAGPGTFKVTTATAPGATTTVPNVVGSTHAAAQTAIIAASLNVASISTGHSDTIPAGSVISQLPVAGSSVVLNVDPIANPNPAVELVVSLGPGIVVPNVVGLTQAAAEAAITAVSGLSVGVISTSNSNTIPPGSVISQNAPANTVVTATDTNAISLVVSQGPVMTPVPGVVSLTQAAAESAITSASLTVGTVSTAYDATVTAGSVISQTPAAGASVPLGSAVNLVVSLGPVTMVTVPNVIGSTQTAALNTLTSAGLNGTVTYANSVTVPSGTVISQTPLAGTSVATGSAVALVVSSGPAVPNVVSLSQVAAGAAIAGATLTVGTIDLANSDTVPAGSVISQNPTSGTTVLPGSAVNLVVSLGPPVPGELSSSILSDAYGLVATGATIKARVVTFAGLVDFNLDKSAFLNGGYSDNTFTTTNGFTTLHGKMTISRGTLRVSNLKIY